MIEKDNRLEGETGIKQPNFEENKKKVLQSVIFISLL